MKDSNFFSYLNTRVHPLPLLFLILISLICQACSEQVKDSEHRAENDNIQLLKIHKETGVINSLKLFGFLGSQQIEIYQNDVNDSLFTFQLNNLEKPAIYRIQTNEEVFDFVFNGESISINLTADKGIEGVEVIESKENKFFYEFLEDYNHINTDDSIDICHKVEMLKKKMTSKNTNLYSHELAKFLLNSTYNCNKLSTEDFLERMDLNRSLLRSPYISGQLETVILSLTRGGISSRSLLEKLNEDKDADLSHFIRSIFWDLGVKYKDTSFVSPLYSSNDSSSVIYAHVLDSAKNNFDIGQQINFADFDIPVSDSLDQYIIFIGDLKNESSLKKDFQVWLNTIENTKSTYINKNELSAKVKSKYTILGSPTVLLLSKNGYLIDRYTGESDLQKLVNI
jgi:hypothetical protein